ncbi:MAG: metalloregulator ArsR/SmtB family transcription factor, partial [Alphaproteobacteria bacterium]
RVAPRRHLHNPPDRAATSSRPGFVSGLAIDQYFYKYRIMEKMDVINSLCALAQETRLDMFRLLVRSGPAGLPAGGIAERLGLAGPTASFHLKELRQAGLVTQHRQGRSLIYVAAYQAMSGLLGYLTEHCCRGPDTGTAIGEQGHEALARVDCC